MAKKKKNRGGKKKSGGTPSKATTTPNKAKTEDAASSSGVTADPTPPVPVEVAKDTRSEVKPTSQSKESVSSSGITAEPTLAVPVDVEKDTPPSEGKPSSQSKETQEVPQKGEAPAMRGEAASSTEDNVVPPKDSKQRAVPPEEAPKPEVANSTDKEAEEAEEATPSKVVTERGGIDDNVQKAGEPSTEAEASQPPSETKKPGPLRGLWRSIRRVGARFSLPSNPCLKAIGMGQPVKAAS